MLNAQSIKKTKTMKTVIYIFWSLYEFTDYGGNHSYYAVLGVIYTTCKHIRGDAGKVDLMLKYQRACKHKQRPSFNQHLTTVHKHKSNDWLTDWLDEQLAKWMTA